MPDEHRHWVSVEERHFWTSRIVNKCKFHVGGTQLTLCLERQVTFAPACVCKADKVFEAMCRDCGRLPDLKFSLRWCWGFESPGMIHTVNWEIYRECCLYRAPKACLHGSWRNEIESIILFPKRIYQELNCKWICIKQDRPCAFNWINQPNAATSQVYYLSCKYSSTCFGHPHAHHQELQQLQ
jgi:hypothetical protein